MAKPLAVVPALNIMIPLCSLLALGASVSQSSLVFRVVSKTALLALITLAWLFQPMSKIQSIVSQLWGHVSYSCMRFLACLADFIYIIWSSGVIWSPLVQFKFNSFYSFYCFNSLAFVVIDSFRKGETNDSVDNKNIP